MSRRGFSYDKDTDHAAQQATRLSQLSPSRRLLVQRIQALRFGRIANLVVTDREPQLTSGVQLVQTLKLDSREDHKALPSSADYELKKQVLRLLEVFDSIGNGTIASITIADGLPTFVAIKETAFLTDAGMCTESAVKS